MSTVCSTVIWDGVFTHERQNFRKNNNETWPDTARMKSPAVPSQSLRRLDSDRDAPFAANVVVVLPGLLGGLSSSSASTESKAVDRAHALAC